MANLLQGFCDMARSTGQGRESPRPPPSHTRTPAPSPFLLNVPSPVNINMTYCRRLCVSLHTQMPPTA